MTPRIFTAMVPSIPGIGGGGCTRVSVEENDFRVFQHICLYIVGLRPCLAVGPLCLSTAGVYGWNDNVRIVSELDHLVTVRHWVKVCCVYDVCRRTDAGTLDYVRGYSLER